MRGLSALVAALLALGTCNETRDRGGFGEPPPPTTPAAPTSSPVEGAQPSQPVRVSAPGGFRFEPTSLRIEAGRLAAFEFANRDRQEHTFVISELAVLMLAGEGQTVRSEVPISREASGRFAFYCSIAGHRDAGMEGVLVVR